jgi:hypothetical protein
MSCRTVSTARGQPVQGECPEAPRGVPRNWMAKIDGARSLSRGWGTIAVRMRGRTLRRSPGRPATGRAHAGRTSQPKSPATAHASSRIAWAGRRHAHTRKRKVLLGGALRRSGCLRSVHAGRDALDGTDRAPADRCRDGLGNRDVDARRDRLRRELRRVLSRSQLRRARRRSWPGLDVRRMGRRLQRDGPLYADDRGRRVGRGALHGATATATSIASATATATSSPAG